MDLSREEASQYFRAAQKLIDKGQFQKASLLLQKSNRLYPHPETLSLLKTCEEQQKQNQPKSQEQQSPFSFYSKTPKTDSTSQNNPSLHQRSHVRSNPNSSSTASYTSEQVALCEKIAKAKTYYDVLDVPTDASDEVIKAGYRKLALKLHPDKNRAPKAEEAFKKVSEAFQCLSSHSCRSKYDQCKDAPCGSDFFRQGGTNVRFSSPEEVFEAFFGSHIFQGQNPYHPLFHATRVNHTHVIRAQPLEIFMRFIVVGFLILSFFSFFQRSEQSSYSLYRTNSFNLERFTTDLKVPYYVTDSFDRYFPPSSYNLRQIEAEIEIEGYRVYCHEEQMQRREDLRRLSLLGEVKQLNELRNKALLQCQRYHRLQRQKNYYSFGY